MTDYIAFLRGINVGGKAVMKMADLKDCLVQAGLDNVRTYIQSGNILFTSESDDKRLLAMLISASIEKTFSVPVAVAIFETEEWQAVVKAAPTWWGLDNAWKHNILILIEPFVMEDVLTAIGELKPNIEKLQPGKGVIYQSLAWDSFAKATSGKLAGKPVYKQMTVRNYNTATKLAKYYMMIG